MKILIIEDDKHIREALALILKSEGYDCYMANNGQTGIEQYNKYHPELILLDIMMPNKDGYAVCKEIRKNDSSTAIIFISAKSEEIDRVLGLELGADDYIMKPFGKHEVIARVRAVSRRYLFASKNESKHTNHPESFNMGELIVHPSQLRAEKRTENENTIIELSLRECKTLQLLHNKKNQVVSRDELFNYCWGRDYLPNSRTLDQHILKLRKLIETNPKQPKIIQTVHGVGFRYDK